MTKARSNGFIKLDHELMDSPAWRTAPLGVRCVVLAIWRRHTGKNNGLIPYSARDAQADLGCGSHQAVRYLRAAEERGFIVPTRRSSFDWKSGAGAARATTWRITMERCKGRDPTNELASWTPPENLNNGCRSDNATVAGATTLTRKRLPERQPLGPEIGCRSDNTSKTKSSYQGESPRGAGAGFLVGCPATRAACLRQWLTSGRVSPGEVATCLGMSLDEVELVASGKLDPGPEAWAALAILVKGRSIG